MRQDEIARLLPEIYRRTRRGDGPLDAVLEVLEAFHDPAEQKLERLDEFLDPVRADDEFVPYLAGWVDLDRLFREEGAADGELRQRSPLISSDLGRLRALVRAAARLSQWRGTKRGLMSFMELATGVEGFEVIEQEGGEEGGRPYHITVRAPPEADRWRSVLERIVATEKPAHVTHDLVIEEPEQEG